MQSQKNVSTIRVPCLGLERKLHETNHLGGSGIVLTHKELGKLQQMLDYVLPAACLEIAVDRKPSLRELPLVPPKNRCSAKLTI